MGSFLRNRGSGLAGGGGVQTPGRGPAIQARTPATRHADATDRSGSHDTATLARIEIEISAHYGLREVDQSGRAFRQTVGHPLPTTWIKPNRIHRSGPGQSPLRPASL